MPEAEPKQPDPTQDDRRASGSSNPQSSAPKSGGVQPRSGAQSRTLQVIQQQVLPVVKTVGLRLIQLTTQLGQFLLQQIQKQQARANRTSTSVTDRASTSALGRQTTPAGQSSSDELKPLPERLWEIWVAILGLVRSYLPGSVGDRLSNPALSGVVIGGVILLFWILSSLFSPAPAPKVAGPEPTVQPAPPAEIVSKGNETPVAIAPQPKADPAPNLELTPEQSLIAAIQDQVAEISDRYASGLIGSVQANFRDSQLTVRVGEGWYSLMGDRQSHLADDLLQRSLELDFNKLEIRDATDELVARSPVVGSHMVILQHKA